MNSITISLSHYIGVPSSTSLEIQSNTEKLTLSIGQSLTHSFTISPLTLSLTLLSSNSILASSSLHIDSFPSSRPQSIWLTFKDHSGNDNNIKAKLSLHKEITPHNNGECPYLSLLASGKADEFLSKRLQEASKTSSDKFMRINFDPDAPPRLGVEIKTYEPASLAEMNSARLEAIGGDQIKKQVRILAEEIKKIGLGDVDGNRELLKKEVEKRVEQEQEFEKFTENSVLEITELISEMWGLEEKRALVSQEILNADSMGKGIAIEIDEAKGKLGKNQREILIFKAERARFSDLQSLLNSQQQMLEKSKNSVLALSEKFKISQNSADSARKAHEGLINKLSVEAEEFDQRLQQLMSREPSIIDLNAKLKSHLADLKVKLSATSKGENPDISDPAAQRYAGISRLQDLQNQAFEYDQESRLKFKSALKQKEDSGESLKKQYQELDDNEKKGLDQQLERYLTQNELTYVEQSCCIQGDLSNLSESLSKFLKFYSTSNKSALGYLNSTSSQILKETDTIKEQCNRINGIMGTVAEKDAETEEVKALMAEIKLRHPPFIPKIDDPIDIALFEFIKAQEEPIPIPFTREESGIYLFGTRRVFLKLENGNIVIRIGGGFTSIQNFIEIYTPLELERQEEEVEETNPQFRTTQARFSQSPSKTMSPLRASRILQGAVDSKASGSPLKPSSPFRKPLVKK